MLENLTMILSIVESDFLGIEFESAVFDLSVSLVLV